MKTASHSLYETYYEISRQAQYLLGAEYSTILLEENGELKRVYSSNMTLANSNLRKNGRTYKSFHSGKIFVAPINSVRDINPHQLKLQVKSIVFIPLVCKQGKVGILNVLSRKMPPFTEKELHLIEVLGALGCLSILNARLSEENKQLLSTREIFFSAAAHELKTPLTTIKLYGQLLQNAIAKKQLPNSRWADILVKEISRITRLINEFWLRDQIKSGHLVYNRGKVLVEELVTEAIMEFRANYTHKIIFRNTLKEKKIAIHGDFDRLLGALTNILNNAGKYSPTDSDITLTLLKEYEYVVIQVHDKGSGISKKNISRIFDVFYKGSKREGIGMGLYLAKQIVDAHRGNINVASKLGHGTIVSIYLPAQVQKHEHSRRTAT